MGSAQKDILQPRKHPPSWPSHSRRKRRHVHDHSRARANARVAVDTYGSHPSQLCNTASLQLLPQVHLLAS